MIVVILCWNVKEKLPRSDVWGFERAWTKELPGELVIGAMHRPLFLLMSRGVAENAELASLTEAEGDLHHTCSIFRC